MTSPRPPFPEPPPDSRATPSAQRPDYAAAKRIGEVISDRYRIVELVATGGMGAVYKAEHLLLRKWMAIKLLHPESQGLPEHMARFEREAIAGAHIQHPNIASATDFGALPDGSNFLVLEYVRGVTLEQIIDQGPVHPARAIGIARQIAAALAAAHERGVIHRDLKPRNVLIEQGTDAVKVIDFGLAKVPIERLSTTDSDNDDDRSTTARITLSGTIFGTPAYMAPEAAGGMDMVDARSDLYALGLILYEMLAGRHPFDGLRPAEIFREQCTVTPPPLMLRSPGIDVPRDLEALVMCLLRKAPATRYGSAGAVVEALDAAARKPGSLGVHAWKDPLAVSPMDPRASPYDPLRPMPSAPDRVRSSAAPAQPDPRRARRRRTWALVAAAAVLSGVALGALWLRHRAPSGGSSPSAPAGAGDAALTGVDGADGAPASGASDAGSADEPARLVLAAREKDWDAGEEALFALIEKQPAAFNQRDVMTAAAAVAVKSVFRSTASGEGRGDQLFDALANRLGTDGLDVAYEIVSGYGGTRAAERALGLLRDPEVLQRASPPLRIAVELRAAPCRRKSALFDRAAQEGDARVLVSMEMLRSSQCQPRIGQCCFHHDPGIERAVTRLRARLRN